MNDSEPQASQSWPAKFACAISGIAWAVRTQSSFWVHVPITVAVIALAAWLNVDNWQWCALLGMIALVFTAELINTSIELIVKVVHPEHDARIGTALDAAAGAVLVASIIAVIVGLIILAPRLYALV